MENIHFFSALYGIEDFFILWMQSFLLLFKQCPSKCLWFQWFLAFSLRSMVSMVSSFQACSDFFLCLSGVITITHDMVVVLMGKSSFFICALWFQWFLRFLDAVISSFVWAVLKKVCMVWMISSFLYALYGFKFFFRSRSSVSVGVFVVVDYIQWSRQQC